MKNKIKPILIILLIILAVFMAGKYVLDSLFGDVCGNEITKKIPSPNGEKVAYIFTRNCGATTGFSPQLTILDKMMTFKMNREIHLG